MIHVPLVEELRAIRRRLSEEAGLDVEKYAAMLRLVADDSKASYVTKPLLPPSREAWKPGGKEAG